MSGCFNCASPSDISHTQSKFKRAHGNARRCHPSTLLCLAADTFYSRAVHNSHLPRKHPPRCTGSQVATDVHSCQPCMFGLVRTSRTSVRIPCLQGAFWPYPLTPVGVDLCSIVSHVISYFCCGSVTYLRRCSPISPNNTLGTFTRYGLPVADTAALWAVAFGTIPNPKHFFITLGCWLDYWVLTALERNNYDGEATS